MVECGVLFEVRTELLTIIKSSVGFKGLTLKRVATSIILLAWNICAHILGIWLVRANLYRVNVA
jgi:hypothetical protein